jgi:hypothetical protein
MRMHRMEYFKINENYSVVLELLQAVKRHRYGKANRCIYAFATNTQMHICLCNKHTKN